jgi:hypothetical protein
VCDGALPYLLRDTAERYSERYYTHQSSKLNNHGWWPLYYISLASLNTLFSPLVTHEEIFFVAILLVVVVCVIPKRRIEYRNNFFGYCFLHPAFVKLTLPIAALNGCERHFCLFVIKVNHGGCTIKW